MGSANERPAGWTFFTNHAHVLFFLATAADARMRDIADAVGITERAVHRILHELEAHGYVEITRVGRRNTYAVCMTETLRHPIEKDVRIDELFRLLKRAQRRAE